LFTTERRELFLPAIRPDRDQLQKAKAISQRDTKRIDKVQDIVDIETTEDIRVLKVQREYQAHHIREPSNSSVRQTRPDSDKTEADLDGSANGS